MTEKFEDNIKKIYGTEGSAWLSSLPQQLKQLAKKHRLSQLKHASPLTFNYVATGYQDNRPIALKLGLNIKALTKETLCLTAFNGHGAVDIYDHSEGMLIMQQAIPGTTLKSYFPSRDNEAIEIVCHTLKQLHQAKIPLNHKFYSLPELLQTLDHITGIPNAILNKAKKLRDQLLASTDKTVLLHGDLHHDNLLKNDNDWLAIDPKGFIGDPIFDICAFICNPSPELIATDNFSDIINHRIKACAETLQCSEQRIRDWHYVKCVLCWAWGIEDNINDDYFCNLIQALDQQL